jgi:hypothetical protein
MRSLEVVSKLRRICCEHTVYLRTSDTFICCIMYSHQTVDLTTHFIRYFYFIKYAKRFTFGNLSYSISCFFFVLYFYYSFIQIYTVKLFIWFHLKTENDFFVNKIVVKIFGKNTRLKIKLAD